MPGLFEGFEGYRVLADSEVDQALRSALIAVDANVLLNLYRYNAQTTDDLMTIFEKVSDRLIIPHQAMREFHRNRLKAIGNPEGVTQNVRDSLNKNERSTNDALVAWAKQVALDDEELARLRSRIAEAFDTVREAVGTAEPDRVRADTSAADDRVLTRLAALLDGKVLSRLSDQEWEELLAEGRRRVGEQIPPGYLDAEKGEASPEGGAGDFLVYRQACDEAVRRSLNLVIITGDEKEDWWWRHRGVAIGPRQEMVKEFFDLSGGHQLFLLTPRGVLQRSGIFDVDVSPTSLEDASRPRYVLEPPGVWAAEGVHELMRRLRAEGLVQAEVIQTAADLGGTIDRETVYGVCGFDDSRMLRGFTRPTARITSDLQREGTVADGVAPMLEPLYPDESRAAAFRIPLEVVVILQAVQQPGLRRDGKYGPLAEWLNWQTASVLPMTFDEIESRLGTELAPSARKHLPYWYSTQNSLGKAIADGGYKASRIDLEAETLTLVRRATE